MMSNRIKQIFFSLTLGFLLLPVNGFSQNNEVKVDTSEYIPLFYKGALDLNLMIAASHGYTSEIKRLITQGADITVSTNQGVTALIFAVSNNQTEAAKMLIDLGSDPNKITIRGETPFFIAVKNGNSEIVEALIRTGIDIDNTDQYDATGLHYAAAYDYFSLADMLLYYDASTEKKTIEGSTPLIVAVYTGSVDIADLLIQNGANIEATDNEGYTPFLVAAMNGDTLLMNLLYKKGANIYATNTAHHNALTLCIVSNSTAISYLLRIGKNWTDQENHPLDPYVVASRYGRKEIVKILKDNNITGNLSHSIDQMDISLSTRFFVHDIYTGMSLSLREPYLNGGFIFGFDTKLWYTRVLMEQSENQFYKYFNQYWNKESIVYGGVFKSFRITDNPYKGNFELTTTLTAGYRFSSVLKGTLLAPANKLSISPAVALKWTKKDYSLFIGAEYLKTDFYKTGPIWVRLGGSYNIYFDKIRVKRKTLKWL